MPTSRAWCPTLADVVLTVVPSRVVADLVVGLLADNGIRAFAAVDDLGGMQPSLQMLGVRVLVAIEDLAEAQALLASGIEPDGP